MNRINIDASILVKWFYPEDEFEQASQLFSIVENKEIEILIPPSATLELSNSLLVAKKFTIQDTKRALEKLYSFGPKIQAENASLIKKTIEIAENWKITTYDAVFIALSEIEEIPLFTADYKHHRKEISSDIIWLSEWNGKI